MFVGVIKLTGKHAFNSFYVILYAKGLIIGDVGNHDLTGTIGSELLLHYFKTLPGL